MTKQEFIEKAISNGIMSGNIHVWCSVDDVDCEVEHNRIEHIAFQVSESLKNNYEDPLWDKLFEQFKYKWENEVE